MKIKDLLVKTNKSFSFVKRDGSSLPVLSQFITNKAPFLPPSPGQIRHYFRGQYTPRPERFTRFISGEALQ
jgi:hypothetical protein